VVIKIGPVILWTELCCLYLIGPIGLTALLRFELLNISKVPLVFFALFILSILLLAKTPSFKWRSLLPSSWRPEWRIAVVFLLIGATFMISIIQLTNPNHFFGFPRRAPEIYLIVMSLYPILSVIPQGIIYRVLFFKRYGELFSDIRIALLISSIAFSFAHLLFQNLFAVCLTFFGALVFNWAHHVRGSFWTANLLHVVGGWCIWTIGLGEYFYHGAI
jgi:membrane protease YdiL (CAAX protease family)